QMPLLARKSGSETPAETDGGPNHIPVKLALLLVLFSFAIFGNTIDQYLVMDDFDVLYSAKHNKLSHVLLGYDTVLENKFFRPIPMFSFWLQSRLFGLRPAVFHITTVLLHALAAILAANLFYLLFRNLRAAAIFGFVFIAFPNHAEVVNWISINFTSWAAVFYLATLNLFGYYRLCSRVSLLAISLVSFLAALSSKEVAFTLPASLVLFDYFLSRSRHIRLPVTRRVADHCIYFGLLFLALFLTRMFLSTGYGYLTVEGEDLISLYLNNPYVLAVDLTHMYLRAWKYLIGPLSPENPFQKPLTILIFLSLGVACALLVLKRRIKLEALAYPFFFALITLLPMLGTFKLLTVTHWIRFLYLPSVASCYIISVILEGILIGLRGRLAKSVFMILVMLPVVYLTKAYDNEWIKAQHENKRVIQSIVQEFHQFPQYSRIYVSGIPWMKKSIPRIDYGFPSAIGLYYDRKYLEAALSFLPGNKILALDREPYVDGEWQHFFLAWDDDGGTLSAKRTIQPEPNAKVLPYIWDFARPGNQRYLRAANEIIPGFEPGFSYPIFMVDGPWALLWLPRVNPRQPIKYLTLEMMLKKGKVKRDISRVFWVTEDDLEVTGGKSIAFFAATDGEFHEYKIPLYRNGLSLIHPRIVRFAIRPSQNSGTIFSIRKMTVEYY
ncbi:MAG: hypothetical protein JSV16_14300, partial [Candidatus Hydrogenedentota bacterium]